MDRVRVLVVDDDEVWLEAIEMILGESCELSLTADAESAKALVRSSFFSLAILDQRLLGGLSGIDLLRQLREYQHDLRAIILTGYPDVDDAVESIKTGAFDYLSKGRLELAAELRARVDRALSQDLHEEQLLAQIRLGESSTLEFKASARWDRKGHCFNSALEGAIVRTVSAFLNSEYGGVLLIGVDDGGEIVGLAEDYATLRRRDRDGYEVFLVTLLLGAFGKDLILRLKIDYHEVGGMDVFRIAAKPAPEAVYVSDGKGGDHLYIRAGNSTRQLSTKEAVEYCKRRWP